MSIAVLALSFLVMLLGLGGTILPVVPGLPVIWLAMLGYGAWSGWADYGFAAMAATGALVAASLVVDQVAAAKGAETFGSGRAGMVGAVVGGIIGLIALSLPGLVAGVFVGAAACELVFGGRTLGASLFSGLGALLGFLAGSLFKFMLGVILIAYFLWAVLL